LNHLGEGADEPGLGVAAPHQPPSQQKVRWRLRAVAGDASSAWSDWQSVTVDTTQPGEEPLAQTAGPVIRTDQSFTAAAWLRWSDKEGDYTIVEQKGTHQAPFRLGNTSDHGLVFTLTSADAADAAVAGALSGVEPPVDEWFHLAGVYDATTKTASLFLNGALIKAETISRGATSRQRWSFSRLKCLCSQQSEVRMED
ncbi:LamG domain-containing protein, partial [Nonomuraea sp. RK-328]|nr:LamG domain-containing protein [Nonomuraea sp. RK-328]